MNDVVASCEMLSRIIRKHIIDMTYSTGKVGAHLGGSLSMVDMLVVLYNEIIRYDKDNPTWDGRDRVILSKGHAALALYPVLAEMGIISIQDLETFKQDGSLLGGHPSLNGLNGIEFASGSLGQGLSLGVGVCLALKKKHNYEPRVFVFMGDGETDEGSVWEAAASASHFKLDNLVAIIDNNHLQYDGETNIVMDKSNQAEKWKSFGWNVVCIDGHNIQALFDAYRIHTDKPLAIICDTVKGKGVSFMENNKFFHNSRLTEEQYLCAIRELELNG